MRLQDLLEMDFRILHTVFLPLLFATLFGTLGYRIQRLLVRHGTAVCRILFDRFDTLLSYLVVYVDTNPVLYLDYAR